MEESRKSLVYWNIVDEIVQEVYSSDYSLLSKKEISFIKDILKNGNELNTKSNHDGFAFEFETTITLIGIAFTAVDIFVSLYIYSKQNREKTLKKEDIKEIAGNMELNMTKEVLNVINHKFEIFEKKIEEKMESIKFSIENTNNIPPSID